MLNRNGEIVEVYDTIMASAVEETDLILVNGDQIEVTKVVDDGDSILVKGWSYISGDNVTVILTADADVDLWTE